MPGLMVVNVASPASQKDNQTRFDGSRQLYRDLGYFPLTQQHFTTVKRLNFSDLSRLRQKNLRILIPSNPHIDRVDICGSLYKRQNRCLSFISMFEFLPLICNDLCLDNKEPQ